jgi:hypothetical protein
MARRNVARACYSLISPYLPRPVDRSIKRAIKRANVLHAGNVRREFSSDNLYTTSDDFRPSKG